MSKKTGAFCLGMLLGLIIICLVLSPLRVLDPSLVGLLVLAPQEMTNPVPQVIPSLREWQGGHGSFTLDADSRIVIDSSYVSLLRTTAQVFRDDLFSETGRIFPIAIEDAPQSGDFFLTLRTSDSVIGSQGYLFQVGDAVVISAHTAGGIFYGTRTALQILLQDPEKEHIPRGNATDYPEYPERGFMLDVGRKFFPISVLEDYVKFMAWFKMDDFQLHFNDNAPNAGNSPDWMQQFAAFRLNSPAFPGLAAQSGSYSEQDILQLEAVAAEYNVTITPEIDTPAHDLALTQYRPNLADPNGSKEFLDLSNPATYTFLNALWSTFLPWFTARQVDIGADEYTTSDADHYREFINTYDDYLRSKGKTVRMWGSLSEMQSNIKVNTDIVIDDWNNTWSNPVDMVHQGYSIINANDSLLYIVPKAGYYHDYLDTQTLYNAWEPNIFSLTNPSLDLSPNDPRLLGGMFCEWNDAGSVISDADVYNRVKPAMSTLGQKMWSGTTAGMPYTRFAQLARFLGDGPGTHLAQE
ncbi:MAG TPA: family 20 glycosylhydrolase [Ktedonobacteraceae bacterium]|nr:family 20 glycosylhydrolase [Ktedonobacteraceae bacterium]